MSNQLASLGQVLDLPAILCLWLAVLVRLPSAIRSRPQRGLWLAVATAAIAMTLNLPAITALILRLSGQIHATALARNIIGVLSAGAALYFVATSAKGKWRATTLYTMAAVSVVTTTLLLLDGAAPPHQEHTMTGGELLPSVPYWLTLISVHLAANVACIVLCWAYGRRTSSHPLKTSLRLFAVGSALAALFWLVYLFRLTLGTEQFMPLMPLLMNLHALCKAASLLVPTYLSLRQATDDMITTWRLWPLWHDLVDAAPHVALTKPRGRILEVLLPPIPRRLLNYRKIIETRDAILVLNDYVAPDTPAHARRHVTDTRAAHANIEATVLACVMRQARHAKLAGQPPREATHPLAIDSGDIDSERTFLIDMARAYDSSTARAFVTTPTTSGRT